VTRKCQGVLGTGGVTLLLKVKWILCASTERRTCRLLVVRGIGLFSRKLYFQQLNSLLDFRFYQLRNSGSIDSQNYTTLDLNQNLITGGLGICACILQCCL